MPDLPNPEFPIGPDHPDHPDYASLRKNQLAEKVKVCAVCGMNPAVCPCVDDAFTDALAEGLEIAGLPPRRAIVERCKKIVRLEQRIESALDKPDWRERCRVLGDQIDRAVEKLVDQLVRLGKVTRA